MKQSQEENPVFKSPKGKLKTVNKLPVPRPFAGNQTIMLPNEDDFEKMAKMCSTPFNGKPSFEVEQDENTCAVNILYKHSALDDLNETDNDMGPPAAPGHDDQTNIGAGHRLDTIVE